MPVPAAPAFKDVLASAEAARLVSTPPPPPAATPPAPPAKVPSQDAA
ncbi:hypothetical protein ACWERV_08765 [Streptomyces sp. NPDC004031]